MFHFEFSCLFISFCVCIYPSVCVSFFQSCYLSLHLSLCLNVSVQPKVCPSIFCLSLVFFQSCCLHESISPLISLFPSKHLSVNLSFASLCLSHSVLLSLSLHSLCPSKHLSVYFLTVSSFLFQSVFLFISLSFRPTIFSVHIFLSAGLSLSLHHLSLSIYIFVLLSVSLAVSA